jgi:hypothetical protein
LLTQPRLNPIYHAIGLDLVLRVDRTLMTAMVIVHVRPTAHVATDTVIGVPLDVAITTMTAVAMAVLHHVLVLRLTTTRLLAVVVLMILIAAITHLPIPMLMDIADPLMIDLPHEITHQEMPVTLIMIAVAVTGNIFLLLKLPVL